MPPETALPHHHLRTTCRLCDSSEFERVIGLTPTPPANELVQETALAQTQTAYPLDVYRCASCGHLQLLDIVDPRILFSTYLYVSSTSPVMVNFLANQAQTMIDRLGLKPGDLVVEFGSNDGTLLRFFRDAGMRVVGIDPAANIAPDEPGIEAIKGFFDSRVAVQVRERLGPAALVCAYNVCAHIDDLQEVARGVKTLIGDSGHFVFQVGYLLDVYQKTLFDTIYHEHLDFHHVEPLCGFFARHRMNLLHVERSDIQGGALIGYAGGSGKAADQTVAELITLEQSAGLDRAETFREYAKKIDVRKNELMSVLQGLKSRGKSIAGYGAPAKATTLMHHFALDRALIDYIVDDNPLKQGMYTPGLHVPVVATTEIYRRKPDYVLVLAWNFAESIVAKHRDYAGNDGRFIIPLPDLQIIGN
jgi:SAM-dependent methyltransferase